MQGKGHDRDKRHLESESLRERARAARTRPPASCHREEINEIDAPVQRRHQSGHGRPQSAGYSARIAAPSPLPPAAPHPKRAIDTDVRQKWLPISHLPLTRCNAPLPALRGITRDGRQGAPCRQVGSDDEERDLGVRGNRVCAEVDQTPDFLHIAR